MGEVVMVLGSYLLRIGLVILLLLSGLHPSVLRAQTHYSHRFTRALEDCNATFIQPIENQYRPKMLRKDAFGRYDQVIETRSKDFEMRFMLDPNYHKDVPNITCLALASSLATNAQHFDIQINIFPQEDAQAYYHADWAAYADFIPKRSLTDKYYARLVTIYRVGSGIMHQIMLFDEHSDEKDRRLYSLSFKDPTDSF